MQMFRKPVPSAMQGDRVGVCVTQFDPKLLERGVVCTPGSLQTLYAAVISVQKIEYYRGALTSRAKFHITVGHETVMARISFFNRVLLGNENGKCNPTSPEQNAKSFSFDWEFHHLDEYLTCQAEGGRGEPQQWALLEFERPVTCPPLCLVIGSRLDSDIHGNACRLAFHGKLLEGFEDKNYTETALPRLKISKDKQKEGAVERVTTNIYTSVQKFGVRKIFFGINIHSTRMIRSHSKDIYNAITDFYYK